MNQILVTEKLYITPELKRKKKIYKVNFIISISLIMVLFSFYAYAEYDRNKNEDISQEILEGMNVENDNTTINKDDDVWIIALNGGQERMENNINTPETTNEGDINHNTSNNEAIESNNSINNSSSNSGSGSSASSGSSSSTNSARHLTGTYTAPNGQKYVTVGAINIPSIDVNYPILSETSDKLLKVSVCKFWGCNPNEVGNLCIAGHNYRNSKFFSKVLRLTVGDIIEITDLGDRTLKYSVYDKFTVDPTDVSCTSQLTNGKKVVTLITCTNDSKQRVVVKARAI